MQSKENLVRIGKLEGDLQIPPGAKGIVLFAHGSGSSRHSPRNRFVAEALRKGSLATLLIDLLTPEEDQTIAEIRFDISLLTERLKLATDWLLKDERTSHLAIGYFGASTGAAAALAAAAEWPEKIGAVVSRGGRPDLARAVLPNVQSPTLLIVGGYDEQVIGMNREAFELIPCEKELVIIPRATHLFEEAGALEAVSQLALKWFQKHLTS